MSRLESASLVAEDPTLKIDLQQAFERFAQASTRLEDRYQGLLQESQLLRARIAEQEAEIAGKTRLATLGQMAAAIAHEVRNPLGSLSLFLSMLRQDLSDRPGSLEYVDEMQKSIASLENVVSNILQFAKGGSGANTAPVNLHALLHEQASRLNPRGTSVVTIECTGNPFIRGNEHSLRQLFYNLILNGLQAVKYKGQVHITASEKELGIEIHVSDNGPGIKPELMNNLFEPFVTGRAEGTGLGLAIVQQVVREHQARIEVRSGNGATFSLFFPKLPIAVIQNRSIDGSSAQFSSALETQTRKDTNDT